MTHPRSVRLAMPAEASQIAQVQRAALAAGPLAGALTGLSTAQMTQAWHQAIVAPPLAVYRVLVGVDESGRVVAFAAIGPSDDPDAEPTDGLVAEFCVHPSAQGHGDEDRLLHACMDSLRADGFERATWWVDASDDATRAALAETGWEPDGAHQEIGDDQGQIRIRQIRMHTFLV